MKYKPTSVIERWALDKATKNEDISQCFFCKHSLPKGKCDAFPNGIPKEIKENFFIHTKPYEGDNGILFEAEKDEYNNINFQAMKKESLDELINRKKK
ncbi:hypothetical protein [Clostridium sp.]|uniref:hypothetical protein n=1 Tax=Clostridium sp. TaxID=1506 RepID=UPI001D4E8A79|nr:hypothetical protein [Clostridium sp.]MBS5988009.1 hypothetical protein [Clostridium sp.]